MIPERHSLVTATQQLSREWADEDGLRSDSDKSSDEIASDHHGTSGAYRDPIAPDVKGTTSAAHRAAANIAYARALFIGEARRRRDGALDYCVDIVPVLDPEGRIVPRRSTPELGGEWESISTLGGVLQEVVQPQDLPTMELRP